MKTIYVTITGGQPPPKPVNFFKILMIDIFGNYTPISYVIALGSKMKFIKNKK